MPYPGIKPVTSFEPAATETAWHFPSNTVLFKVIKTFVLHKLMKNINYFQNQKAMLERLQQFQASGLPNGLSFKDVLVQFANMQQASAGLIPNRPPETITTRPEHHIRPEGRRGRQERSHEDVHVSVKQQERLASPSPRLPPPPPYPEISLLPVTTSQSETTQQNSLLHGILTKVTITIQPSLYGL